LKRTENQGFPFTLFNDIVEIKLFHESCIKNDKFMILHKLFNKTILYQTKHILK
jgi:hypothetical protein